MRLHAGTEQEIAKVESEPINLVTAECPHRLLLSVIVFVFDIIRLMEVRMKSVNKSWLHRRDCCRRRTGAIPNRKDYAVREP